jgi:hypothetical protein
VVITSASTITVINQRIKWAGQIARMGKKKNAYKVLVGKPEGKRPLGRHRHK